MKEFAIVREIFGDGGISLCVASKIRLMNVGEG